MTEKQNADSLSLQKDKNVQAVGYEIVLNRYGTHMAFIVHDLLCSCIVSISIFPNESAKKWY